MEPPLGAPFVAELLEQHPNKPRDVIGRMNRWLRIKRLDVLDNRRGILDAFLLRRDDERHERKLCEFLILAVGVQTARNPSMRNSLVAEVRTDLHRIRRKLNPVDVVFASHRMVSFSRSVFRKMGGDPHRVKRLARQSAIFQCRARAQAHLARHYFFLATRTSERRFYRMAAIPMDQLNRRAGTTSHPAVAPRVQHDDQRKQIDTLLGQSILKPARTFLVLDARQDSVTYQLSHASR